MALLMVGQFRAAPDALLNRTAGGEREMMTSATFSFVIGVVAYRALSTSYLVWAALRRDVYKSWLLFAAGSTLVIGIVVSGSRSVAGACAVVVGSLLGRALSPARRFESHRAAASHYACDLRRPMK